MASDFNGHDVYGIAVLSKYDSTQSRTQPTHSTVMDDDHVDVLENVGAAGQAAHKKISNNWALGVLSPI